MGSTNKTAHYELPQFVANDKPSWLGDVNEAMEAIDTGIYGAKSSADGAQQTANNAVAGVASAGTRMDGIQTQLDTVATQANQTATTVTGHTSSIATNSANIKTLNSRMGSTDISSIGDGTVTGAISSIAQGGGGSTFSKKATANGTTFAQQLASLKTAYDALSTAEKMNAIIREGTTFYKAVAEKQFVIVVAGTSSLNAVELYLDTTSTASQWTYGNGSGSGQDISNNNPTQTLELWA